MSRAEKDKAGWLQKRREKWKTRHETLGDPPEVAADRAERAEKSDVDRLRAVGRVYQSVGR